MMRPLCFVLMPFGRKPTSAGATVDFDAVYHDLFAPGIEAVGMEPLRADQELTGGIIHKPMFERLILCDFAVADLTAANANVFYELGIRHAVRPASTVLLFAEGAGQLPFDVGPLRGLPYKVDADGRPIKVHEGQAAIAARLNEARNLLTDSPVFQLVEGFPDIKRLKTDVFRDRVSYREEVKRKLTAARKQGADAVRAIEASLRKIADQEAGVVIDLYLSYRAVKAWKDMISLVDKMSPTLARSVMVQEQLGLAFNRDGQGDQAEHVLVAVLEKQGPSSETYGILGRVYKDRWEAANKAGDTLLAAGFLEKAIEAYLKGFEADWRDAYPGVNAVTLMELKDVADPRKEKLIPVVAYAVERRVASGKLDYWDYATQLELAVLADQREEGMLALGKSLAAVRERWEPETTARNLRLIRETRTRRGEDVAWVGEAEQSLLRRAAS